MGIFSLVYGRKNGKMESTMERVLAIIPAFNEEQNIEKVVEG